MTGDLSASGSVTEQATAASKSGPSESMKKQPPATCVCLRSVNAILCGFIWVHTCTCMYITICILLAEIFTRRNCLPIPAVGDFFYFFCSVKFLSHLNFIRCWASISNSASWVIKKFLWKRWCMHSVYQGLSSPSQRAWGRGYISHCMIILGSLACAHGVFQSWKLLIVYTLGTVCWRKRWW